MWRSGVWKCKKLQVNNVLVMFVLHDVEFDNLVYTAFCTCELWLMVKPEIDCCRWWGHVGQDFAFSASGGHSRIKEKNEWTRNLPLGFKQGTMVPRCEHLWMSGQNKGSRVGWSLLGKFSRKLMIKEAIPSQRPLWEW